VTSEASGGSISCMQYRPVFAYADAVITRLFPATCVLCGAPGADGLDLCADCRADLPVIEQGCVRCALPLPVRTAQHDQLPALCGPCQRKPPPFQHCHAAFRYQEPLPQLIAGLKFRGKLNLLRLMGLLLALSLRQSGADLPDIIVPVPLHPKRLRQRGYNQALELAQVVAGVLQVPVHHRCCERVRWTRPQAELDRKARQSSLRGAFVASADLHDLQVAILDDVVTTASTVSELSRVLLNAGSRRVDVWTLARTG
jgi:ComF family protein